MPTAQINQFRGIISNNEPRFSRAETAQVNTYVVTSRNPFRNTAQVNTYVVVENQP